MPITDEQLKLILEAAIMASGQPMSVDNLLALFVEEKEPPSRDAVKDALKVIEQECEGRGVELKKVSSGYRFQARQEFSPWVSRLWEEKPARYSRALLETLVLIAYKQPITRGEIEHVRGVAVSTNIIKTLLEREWVRVVGHRDVPGKPALYATTKAFLDYFNLTSLEELPTLAEIRDLDKINAELELEEPGAQSEESAAEGEGEVESESEGESEGEVESESEVQGIAAQGEEPVQQVSSDAFEAAQQDQAGQAIQDGQLEGADLEVEVASLEHDEVFEEVTEAVSPDTDEDNDDIDSNLDDRDVVVLDEETQAPMEAQAAEDDDTDNISANLEPAVDIPETLEVDLAQPDAGSADTEHSDEEYLQDEYSNETEQSLSGDSGVVLDDEGSAEDEDVEAIAAPLETEAGIPETLEVDPAQLDVGSADTERSDDEYSNETEQSLSDDSEEAFNEEGSAPEEIIASQEETEELDETYAISSEQSTDATDDDEGSDISNNDTKITSDEPSNESNPHAMNSDDDHSDTPDSLETATVDSDGEYSMTEDYDSKFAG